MWDSASVVSPPQHGKLVVGQDLKVRYTAHKGFNGNDAYVFRRCGESRTGMKGCADIRVDITVSR